ncbi:selenocysteine lyase isoform X2 [Corvus moneduloides]|uniref:selenocysteine lyase isoform X2 n=1 Tax=Corvus moneduloides TaxID=1196302 RepID=UPI001362FB7B|nr:selenocysteine lyase isoform X2 [Corvus moneduloides]
MGAGTEPAEAQCDSLEGKVYLDHNATTPLAPEVAQAVWDAMCQAWGNPSSSHPTGRKAKELIGSARESLARMLGGRPEDIVFTSGGTEANNMVIHTACRHFHESQCWRGDSRGTPHIVTSSVEHDSIRLPLEQLGREGLAARRGAEPARLCPQPAQSSGGAAQGPGAHGCSTDDWQGARGRAGAGRGLPDHRGTQVSPGSPWLSPQFHGPRIGALYARGPGTATPLHPMLFGGGQERSFRPGTENTPMIAGLGQAAELVSKNWEAYEAHMRDVRDYLEATLEASFGKQRICFNSHFKGSKRLCNTCNFSILGPGLQGRRVLAHCKVLLASVGAACHSEKGDRPSPVLLSCGIPLEVARNALRLSVGRSTARADVDRAVQDLVQAVEQLERDLAP